MKNLLYTFLWIAIVGIIPAEAQEYQYQQIEYFTPSGNQHRTMWVWNTKTGKTARYYYDNDAWLKSSVALPENPLGEATNTPGEVMMKYHEYFSPSGNQFRTVYVWNTKTGKMARYYYDNDTWNKSDAALPDKPLGDATSAVGEVMINSMEYYTPSGNQYRTIYVWNTKTGKSTRYYYDDSKWLKSDAVLPENPLETPSTSVGEMMMTHQEYYSPSGTQFRIMFVWNTKTGKAARYYYDNGKWEKSTAAFPETPLGLATSSVGEVMMKYIELYTPSGNQHRTVYVWNTKTGKMVRYYYENEKWEKSLPTIPVNPLGTATALVGEAMMNAMEYYTPSGNQHRTLYIWNTKTGLATRYYYDNEKWEKSTAALPDKPLE